MTNTIRSPLQKYLKKKPIEGHRTHPETQQPSPYTSRNKDLTGHIISSSNIQRVGIEQVFILFINKRIWKGYTHSLSCEKPVCSIHIGKSCLRWMIQVTGYKAYSIYLARTQSQDTFLWLSVCLFYLF